MVAVYGFATAVFSVLLCCLHTYLFAPQAFGDGQYLMWPMMVSGFGWLGGCLLGQARESNKKVKRSADWRGWFDAGWVGLGCFFMPFVTLFGFAVVGIWWTLVFGEPTQ